MRILTVQSKLVCTSFLVTGTPCSRWFIRSIIIGVKKYAVRGRREVIDQSGIQIELLHVLISPRNNGAMSLVVLVIIRIQYRTFGSMPPQPSATETLSIEESKRDFIRIFCELFLCLSFRISGSARPRQQCCSLEWNSSTYLP